MNDKFMDNNFKVGDKVVRTGNTTDYVTRGLVYTVERCTQNTVYLKECPWSYDPHNFELVEQKEKEMAFKNMKFDVAAIAKQLNVEHEEASRIIQEALFEQGYVRFDRVGYAAELPLKFVFSYDDGGITCGEYDGNRTTHVTYRIKPTYTIVEAEEQKEVVELNGKRYNKQELEKALSLLKPIE